MQRLLFFSLILALGLGACAPAATHSTALPPAAPIGRSEPLQPLLVHQGLAFPGDRIIADWSVSLPGQAYTKDSLYSLVDGQADSFFAYNFQQVTTKRYQNAAGALLTVEAWELAQPADAYGLFTQNRAGTPVKMGNDGDADPGRRVAFWQDRYYVQVNTTQAAPDVQVMAFAYYLSQALPTGGERPALVQQLPAQGLTANGFIFFHVELSVQDEVYLGGKNILGLNADTNGVAARYTLDGAPAHLLLIQYPDASQAAAAVQALNQATGLSLLAADTKGSTLGAVFGKASQTAAATLLQAGLAGAQP